MATMEKMYAREIVRAHWNGKEDVMRKKGEELVYQNQKEKAIDIYSAFMLGVSLVTLVTSPQWGKTGVAMYLMYIMTTHNDDSKMTHPDNVFLITGMSDKDWRKQTKERMLDCFKDRVYHRNDMHKMIAEVANKKDVLIIIDECHYGSEQNQTVHECLRTAGLWDIEKIVENNIKILCISATPGSMLIDAQKWGREHHALITARDNGDVYTSFQTLMDEKRVLPVIDLKKEAGVDKLLKTIDDRWADTPKYHILRLSGQSRKDSEIRNALIERGYLCYDHDSKVRIDDIENMLSTKPTKHTFIFIKGFWRAAKTLDDKHVGICFETGKDFTAIVQGLGGRLLGYGRQRGASAPLLFCDVNAIKNYINWLNTYNANYYMVDTYRSSGLNIKKGKIIKKKDTTLHPKGISNLEEAEHGLPEMKAKEPVRIGNIKRDEIPNGVPLATELEIVAVDAFLERYNLKSMPSDARVLSAFLGEKGINANVSYKMHSARDVSNLKNFYKMVWANSEYHIIWLQDDNHVTVIKRNVALLKSLKQGDKVIVHNYLNKMGLYEF